MAGYMTKMAGYVFEGEFKNGCGAAVLPGIVVVIDAANPLSMKLPTADTASKFFCKEVGTIYGDVPAGRFVVESLAAGVNYYFIEQTKIPDRCIEFDMTAQPIEVGELLRAHPLAVGDEFWTSMTADATPVVGTYYGVDANGNIA